MSTLVLNKELTESLRALIEDTWFHKNIAHLVDFLEKHPDGVAISDTASFNRMRDAELMLDCLKGAGVDNWGGYDDAFEDYWNAKEDEDE